MILQNDLNAFIRHELPHLFPRIQNGDRLIYHYTTVPVFEILTRECSDFVCTYCGALNDKAEFSTGIKILEKYFENNPHLAQSISFPKLKSLAEVPSLGAWTMSFSAAGDSLTQWVSYTDRHDGGVALGFSIDCLLDIIGQAKHSPRLLYLVPCLYENTHQDEILRLLNFLFGSYRDELYHQSKSKGFPANESEAWALSTLSVSLIFAAMVKDESFREENEWRIVMQPIDDNITRRCDFIGGKPRLHTHLFGKDFLVAQAVKDIICSPHGFPHNKIVMISNLRKLSAIPRASKSTYISQ